MVSLHDPPEAMDCARLMFDDLRCTHFQPEILIGRRSHVTFAYLQRRAFHLAPYSQGALDYTDDLLRKVCDALHRREERPILLERCSEP